MSVFAVMLRQELRARLRSRWFAAALAVAVVLALTYCLADFSAHLLDELLYKMAASILIAGILIAPGSAALSIVGEREAGTLEQVRMTLVRPGAYLLAKFFGALTLPAFLALAMLPLAGLIMQYGPPIGFVMLLVFVPAALEIFMATAVGLFCSARAANPVQAVLGTYAGLFCFVPMSAGFYGIAFEEYTAYFFYSPGIAEDAVRWIQFGRHPFSEVVLWAVPVLVHFVAVGVLFYWLAWRCLRAESALFPHAARPQTKTHNGGSLAQFLGGWRPRPIPDWMNPVLLKDLRTMRLTRPLCLLLFYGGLWAAIVGHSLLIASIDRMNIEAISGPPIAALMIVLYFTPGIAAVLVARESERGGADQLHMTLLTPRNIAAGKLVAAALPVAGAVVAAGFAAAALIAMAQLSTGWLEPGHIKYLVRCVPGLFISLAAAAAALAGLCLFAASFSRRILAGLFVSYGVALSWGAVVPILLMNLFRTGYGFSPSMSKVLYAFPGSLPVVDYPDAWQPLLLASAVYTLLTYLLLVPRMRRLGYARAR